MTDQRRERPEPPEALDEREGRESGLVRGLPRAGHLIGDRYRVVRALGTGGMGSLWEVEHRSLGSRFALKLLHDGTDAGEEARARFEREARTAASIDHPNVVNVVDYHVDEGLGPFLVMELLRGRTLRDHLEGAMWLEEILWWLHPIGRALDVIHDAGFVHRDIKPANVMCVERPEGPLVKLVDFGLAARSDRSDRVTRKGMLLGTPHYLAPEVGIGKPATPQSDIYALAIMAFEMLTGLVPFDGPTGIAILSAKLNSLPPPIEVRSVPFAPPIQQAIRSALDPDPSARPARATEFVAALDPR